MSDYRHSPDLPWGYWMRTATSPGGGVTVIDEEGRSWLSIRSAFWSGRLRMCRGPGQVQDEQLELMLAMLASMHRGIVALPEQTYSIFDGDHLYARFWRYWMQAEGLVDNDFRNDPLIAKPSAEGIAVLRMLAATRPIELNAIPIGAAAVRFYRDPYMDDEYDRHLFEAKVDGALPYLFVREKIFGSESISLLTRNPRDAIPMARTIWHLPFPDAMLRDRAFRWMIDRSDRWTSWGELVTGRGPTALTQHFMTLVFAGHTERQSHEPPHHAGPLAISHDEAERP
ncbi:hypothetical protein [Sphingomonas sp. Leaf25]|uniref:hypothetical protein n=1 Tax=Sphingomonas sp. Leaf25 TaxID=1735692 RepID=UPI0006FA1EC4|nr:hypothetical protein [Sphingomonas sp. Leaf25]KQN06927.1 hypothetical protein ASE78_15000 [Sphingomonas sp. Leaf25]